MLVSAKLAVPIVRNGIANHALQLRE